MEIKKWIKDARERAEMTQEELGEKLSRTKGNVSGWEKGHHEPSFSQILRISEVTGHSVLPILRGHLTRSQERELGHERPGAMSSLSPEQMMSFYANLSQAKREELTRLMVAARFIPGLSVEVIGLWKENAVPDSGAARRGTRKAAPKPPPEQQEGGSQ